jgi:glc operon protein GlcG
MNVPMAIAVTDPSGDLVYFATMENAPYSSIQIAQHKATTAARFRRPTRAFDDQLRAGNMFFLTFDVSAAPGGLPIVRQGKLIGPIRVSGGSGAQDEQVGRAGLASP